MCCLGFDWWIHCIYCFTWNSGGPLSQTENGYLLENVLRLGAQLTRGRRVS